MIKKLVLLALSLSAVGSYAQYTLVSYDFESDTPGYLYQGFKYSYTDGFIWNNTLAAPNNLAFYNGGTTNYIITADPLNPENQVFYVDGAANLAMQPVIRGMFFMKLDFTAGGAYTPAGGLVKVSYSFRMMRAADDPDSPTKWQIGWTSWFENPDNAILEPGSTFADQTVVKSFTTSGNRDTWVTVEGSFLANLDKVDTSDMLNTAIRVEAMDGAYVSPEKGLFYLDDVLLTISQGEVVEPATWAGYAIDEETGNVDTGAWLGWLNVTNAPWIYSYSLGNYIYLNESDVDPEGGAWAYTFK